MENKLSAYDTALDEVTSDVVVPEELALVPLDGEASGSTLDAQGDAMQSLIDETPEVLNLGNELNSIEKASPTLSESAQPQSREKLETKEVRGDILNSYQERFGITKESLEGIEGFADLSPGQQRMALENLSQLTVGRIHEDAIDGHSEDYVAKQKDAKFMGKVWNGLKESFGKKFDIVEREKKSAAEIQHGGISEHKTALTQMVEGMKNFGPAISENKESGELEVQFIETEGMSLELAKIVEAFNAEGSKFSKIPYEWSLDTATPEQQKASAEAKETYERERGVVLEHMKNEGGKDGEAKAMSTMAHTESQIEMQRFIQTCPDATKELEQIQNQNAWTSAMKSVGTERGLYMAGGFLARTALGAMAGFVAAPATAVALGAIRGWRKAGDTLRDQDKAQRAGKEIGGETKLQKNMIESVRDEGDKQAIGYRGSVEKVDALVKKIQGTESSTRDTDALVESLRQRIAYTQQKISEGKMVFGSKEEKLANQYALTRSLAEAEALLAGRTTVDKNGNTVEERLDRMLEKKDDAVAHARTIHKVKQAAHAGLIGGALVGIGASAADLLKWYNGGDSAIATLLGKEPTNFSGASIKIVEEAISREPIVRLDGSVVPDVVTRLNQEATARSYAEYMGADTAGKKFIAQTLGMSTEQVDSKVSSILSSSPRPPFEENFEGSSVLTESQQADGINGLDLSSDYKFPTETGQEWVETEGGLNVIQEDLLTAPEGAPLYSVQSGDSLLKIFAKEIPNSQNTDVMRTLIKMTPDELKGIGVTSGNMNLIRPGDNINIAKMQELLASRPSMGAVEEVSPVVPRAPLATGFRGPTELAPRAPVTGIHTTYEVFPNTTIPPAVADAEDAQLTQSALPPQPIPTSFEEGFSGSSVLTSKVPSAGIRINAEVVPPPSMPVIAEQGYVVRPNMIEGKPNIALLPGREQMQTDLDTLFQNGPISSRWLSIKNLRAEMAFDDEWLGKMSGVDTEAAVKLRNFLAQNGITPKTHPFIQGETLERYVERVRTPALPLKSLRWDQQA